MYDNFKVANYSQVLLSPELYGRHLSRLFSGDVVDGLTVTPGTGLQVVLAPGNTLIRYGSANVASARLVSLVADFNLAIATPDVSNPRIDLVVLYVDNGVTLPGGTPTVANLDGPGVAKAIIVQGTAAASPSAPNSTAIQAAVGPGNPYTVLAQVRVDSGVGVIAANKITDVRAKALVSKTRIDFNSGVWWEEIGRTTLSSLGDTITVSSLPARKYLRVLVSVLGSGTVDINLRFNGDTGNNYSRRRSDDGAADSTATNGNGIGLGVPTTGSSYFATLDLINIANIEKVVNFESYRPGTPGAAAAPSRAEGLGKWVNTAALVNSIILFNVSGGDYAIGSEVIVLGHD